MEIDPIKIGTKDTAAETWLIKMAAGKPLMIYCDSAKIKDGALLFYGIKGESWGDPPELLLNPNAWVLAEREVIE